MTKLVLVCIIRIQQCYVHVNVLDEGLLYYNAMYLLVGTHDAQESVGRLTCIFLCVQCYFGEYFKVNRLFQGLCSANSMKLIFTTNWSIYLSIVIHFIFKSSNAILMVGFVLTNFLMQMLKYLIHAKYMQKIHHLQDQREKRQILTWR